nr:hypothetical protein GCM10023233_04100 [Brevibacterium otitidis]
MGDHDDRAPDGQLGQGLLDRGFGVRVGERGRFVEHEDRGVGEQAARDREALLFTARKVALLTDPWVVERA